MRQSKIIPGVDPKLLIKDAAKLMPDPARRGFLRNEKYAKTGRPIKSISARELFREFPRIKKRLWSGELWEDGYFARTVGDRMTRQIIDKYIKHHRDIEQGPAQLL